MNKKILIWSTIILLIVFGAILFFNQNNEEETQEDSFTQNKEENTNESVDKNGSEVKEVESLPTMEDLEINVVLGEGNLPETITDNNTKIFEKNGINDVFVIQFVEGEINRPTKGKVLTDEICEPDLYGYYHCWNNVELDTGEVIRGLTIHDMAGGVPCLSPETEVIVTPYKNGYFLLQRNI